MKFKIQVMADDKDGTERITLPGLYPTEIAAREVFVRMPFVNQGELRPGKPINVMAIIRGSEDEVHGVYYYNEYIKGWWCIGNGRKENTKYYNWSRVDNHGGLPFKVHLERGVV